MLCQLVCVDRRYQRMNCFNIREIQSILKRKFFTDLINNHDHRDLLDKTAIGLRFKTNNLNSINSNIYIFFNYGIEFTSKIRKGSFNLNNESLHFSNTNLPLLSLINFFNHFQLLSLFNQIFIFLNFNFSIFYLFFKTLFVQFFFLLNNLIN